MMSPMFRGDRFSSIRRRAHGRQANPNAEPQGEGENATAVEASDAVEAAGDDEPRRPTDMTRDRSSSPPDSDLEAFSYSVSHDLKAPLRAIEGFSNMLLDDYGDRLDETGRGYVQRVLANVQHMSTLIEDVLDFSRATRADLRRMPTDLGDLARRVVETLESREPQRKVAVTIGHGLFAKADPRLVRIVLDNLINNAWKFTSRLDEAHIVIGKEAEPHEDGHAVFFVRDDGVGFDATTARRLFTPFYRFHDEREFEGNGVGLATAKRIVDRHGGRIWAESRPGEGATFKFTLG